jgi:hypothetical protein
MSDCSVRRPIYQSAVGNQIFFHLPYNFPFQFEKNPVKGLVFIGKARTYENLWHAGNNPNLKVLCI